MPVSLLLALPLVSAALHVAEEFVWPGGFAAWFRRYRPETAVSVTPRFLALANAAFLLLCLTPILLGPTANGYGLWLYAAAVQIVNALFHVRATWRMREYSPGLVTSLLLYLPLGAYGFWSFLGDGRASPGTAVMALLVGVAYHVWSARTHRRRAGIAGPD